MLKLRLPYPPSVNHYWALSVIRKGRRHIPLVRVGERGIKYREAIKSALAGVPKLLGPVRVSVLANPPDRRKRDLDNLLKCLLDSLTHAGLWADDSQISALSIEWSEAITRGQIEVFADAFQNTKTPTIGLGEKVKKHSAIFIFSPTPKDVGENENESENETPITS